MPFSDGMDHGGLGGWVFFSLFFSIRDGAN